MFLLFAIVFLTVSISSNVYASESINWTDEELEFIEEHPVIRLAVDPGFVPFEFIDENGQFKGIAADYLNLISERTGLTFEVAEGLTWPEAYDKAKAKELDALSAIGKTEERENYFLFSKPYYYYKRVIVTKDTETNILDLDDLEGRAVAVQRNSSHHSYLLSFPNINLSLYDSVEAALTAVATGNEIAFVGNLATTDYLIRMNGIPNLRLISFEAEKQQALYFAVRNDWPILINIYNKALDSISDSERIAIHNKWVAYDTKVDYGPLLEIIIALVILTVVVLGVSSFWIAKLRKEIAKRKEIQNDLEKAKIAAHEANEFKSKFMARMSHEIRTPLNAIMGMTYLMKKTDITLTQNMYLDSITQAANNMLSIINDILDFSKIEAGKVELEHTSFSMDKVIQNVVNIISYKINEQQIGFRLSKDPLVPNWFFGDSKRIEQILLNVLNNAVKFTSTGEVSLDVRLLAKENENYHISFTIKDTGMGMTEEQINKLFTPFEQTDSSINRRFGGSGLGLSIVKNLVELMKGEVKVFSTIGEGSTFIIELELTVDNEKELAYIANLTGSHFKNVRTLVLEKSGANINLIESYLSSYGMHCELTTSEASAIAMLEVANGKFAKPFDLLIVDYETPAEGGFRFIEKIRNNMKIVKTPKIMMLLPMMRVDLFDKLNEYGIDIGICKPIIPSIILNGILDIFKLKAVSNSNMPLKQEEAFKKMEKTYYVLLAEDNKTNQIIARSLLSQIGIESIIANNGEEALEKYKENKDKISIILMDLHMPVMNGYEASDKIREISKSIPIVAMTADVILGVKERCEQSGIHYFISKPYDPDHFIRTVKEIILENENVENIVEPIMDQKSGLENMGNDWDLYYQVLTEYYIENQDTIVKLEAAIGDKRYEDAHQIVHKLKSSSGSIGVIKIYDLARKLQKALNEGSDEEINVLQKEFSKLYRILLEEIKTILG
jgi:signal transduction histidine kinase/DNA-binding response OmpR family regulator